MKRILLLLGLVVGVTGMSTMAAAVVFGPSNFGLSGYPGPDCSQPYVPYYNDKYAWESFKYDLEEYKNCIEEYVEAAEKDQKRILEKANEAVDDYNSFVSSIR